MEAGLPLSHSGAIRIRTVVVCGNLVLHRKVLCDSSSKAAGLTVTRCQENHDAIASHLCQPQVSALIVRQQFIEELPKSAILQMTEFGKRVHVLAVLETNAIDPASAMKMLRLGCQGVLPNQFSSKLLRQAVMAVLRGQIWAPPAVVSELLSDLLKAATLKSESGLTPQEARILEMSSEGFKNSDIAEALFISIDTVRWHKRRLNRKLRKANRPHVLASTKVENVRQNLAAS